LVTIISPDSSITETIHGWANSSNAAILDDLLAVQTSVRTSHIKSSLLSGTIPNSSVIVGLEMYVRHKNNLTDRVIIEDKTVVVNANNDGWIKLVDFNAGEYIEFTVSGGVTFNGNDFCYPEGSYANPPFYNGYPHNEDPSHLGSITQSATPYAVNIPQKSLAVCFRQTNQAPSPSTQIIDAYRIGRYSLYSDDKIGYLTDDVTGPVGGGMSSTGQWFSTYYANKRFVQLSSGGSVYAVFNDGLGEFSNNTGSYSVRIRRIRVAKPESSTYYNFGGIDKNPFPLVNVSNSGQTTYDFYLSPSDIAGKLFNTNIAVSHDTNVTFISDGYFTAPSHIEAYPEGVYPSQFGNVGDHWYDPDQVNQTSGAGYLASSLRKNSLVAALKIKAGDSGIIEIPDDPQVIPEEIPPPPPPDVYSGFVQLNRACGYRGSDFPSVNIGYIQIGFNDIVSSPVYNSGLIHVRIIVGSGSNDRLDVGMAFTSQGYTFCSSIKQLQTQNFPQLTVLGSPTDKWGRNWTASELNSQISLVARRSIIGNECTTDTREIDAWWLVVYWHDIGDTFMAERESVKQKINFGKEVTPGTAVTCTNRAMGFKVNPSPNADFSSWRPQGNKLEQLQMLNKEWASSGLTGIPNYDEMGYIIASAVGIPQSSAIVVGSDTKNVHVFRYDNRFEQPIRTYTFEYGTPDSRAHQVTYGFFDSFGINMSRNSAEMNGSMIARAITDGITLSGGVNEVQRISVTGTPTGGTFRLRFKGAETANITYSTTGGTTATNIQTALNALGTIGASGVAVTNPSGTNFDITFSGTAMAGQPQPVAEITNLAFTGGASPSATISRTTIGGFVEDNLVPILPNHISIYLSDAYAGLSAGKLTRARVANFNFGNRADPYWVMDSAVGSFLKHTESPATIKFNLELQADSNGMSLLTNARNGTGKFIRIEALGPNISGTALQHRFAIEAFVKVSALGNLSDTDGVYQANYELTVAEDAGWGNTLVMILENGKTGY